MDRSEPDSPERCELRADYSDSAGPPVVPSGGVWPRTQTLSPTASPAKSAEGEIFASCRRSFGSTLRAPGPRSEVRQEAPRLQVGSSERRSRAEAVQEETGRGAPGDVVGREPLVLAEQVKSDLDLRRGRRLRPAELWPVAEGLGRHRSEVRRELWFSGPASGS